MIHQDVLNLIKQTVRHIEPTADVLIFGSKARNEAGPDSDWDLLVLVDGPLALERDARIRRSLYEIERSTGEVLSPIIRTRQEWAEALARATPFHRSVDRDGVLL